MLAVALIIFAGAFVQSSIGFGFALITMPLLVSMLGIRLAAPLVAIVVFLTEITIFVRYRESFDFGMVMHLLLGAIVGIPIGLLTVRAIDSQTANVILGLIVLGYAIYALITPRLPELAWQGWQFIFGFFSGILSGAYNTGGPPVVIYGSCREWSPEEFKSDLQGFFMVTGVVIIVSHALSGNLTKEVGYYTLYALPGLAAGLAAGFLLSNKIRPELFHRLVLFALIALGIKLLFFS
ncbi:MAG: sulfite exporter TauE/SafE family protein [Candidatus Promineifilaceae bacterium]